jgi:hypothetical protein
VFSFLLTRVGCYKKIILIAAIVHLRKSILIASIVLPIAAAILAITAVRVCYLMLNFDQL